MQSSINEFGVILNSSNAAQTKDCVVNEKREIASVHDEQPNHLCSFWNNLSPKY
jgi:hypothetical protein